MGLSWTRVQTGIVTVLTMAVLGLAVPAQSAVPSLSAPTVYWDGTGVSSADAASATLGATIDADGGAAVTERGIVWNDTGNTPITENPTPEGGAGTGAYAQTVSGLPAARRIYFRGYATNADGTGYSANGSFYTEPSSQAAAPAINAPDGTNYFDLTVNYTVPADADGVLVVARQSYAPKTPPLDGTAYTANARYGDGDSTDSDCVVYCEYVVANAAADGSVTVTGLKEGFGHYFVAYAYKGSGTGISGINYVRTINAAGPVTTDAVPLEGTSHNELWVAANSPKDGTAGGSMTSSDCTYCHGTHHTSQLLPRGLGQWDKCFSCHQTGGPADPKVNIGLHLADGSVDCGTCHSMHSFRTEELYSTSHSGTEGFNLAFVRKNMNKYMNPDKYPPPNGGGATTALDNTVYQTRPDDLAFASGDTPYNAVCQTCHTATDHYTQSGADNHRATFDCMICHGHKQTVDNFNAFRPGHQDGISFVDFGSNAQCTGCHDITNGVLDGVHGDGAIADCSLCHAGSSPNRDNEKLGNSITGKSPAGDARLADGTAAAASWSSVTCLTCHNKTDVPGFHGITIAEVFPSHQLSSDSSGGYDCEDCHATNKSTEQLNTHMSSDTVAQCTAVCHLNTTASAVSGIVAKTVIDNVTFNDAEPNRNDTKCEECHPAKGDYRRHGLTDNDSVASGIGEGTTYGVAYHDKLGNSTGLTVTYSGKLAGAYGGLKVTNYNCGDCHAADPNTKSISALKAMQLHTSTNGTGHGDCLTCHADAPSVIDEIAAGIGATGSVQYCENCHAAANGNGPSGEAMYQYDGVRHHKTGHAQAGDCTYCHADPRPSITTQAGAYAATADIVGTYETGFVADYSVSYPVNTTAQPDLASDAGIPKQPGCRICHTNYGTDGAGTPHSVDVSGGNGNHGYNIDGYSGTATERTTGLTVYANDFNAGLSGAGDDANLPVTATRITQTVIHRIDANNGTSMIKVYDYGVCFGCHSVQVMHAAPIPGTDYPVVANDVQTFPFDTLRYAPGRTVFNLLRGDNPDNATDGDVSGWNQHRLQNQNGMQNLFGQQPAADPRGKSLLKNISDSAPNVSTAADWNFNSVLTHSRLDIPLGVFSHPENLAPNPSGQTPAANHEPFAAYFADIAAPAIPDYVRFLSAVWDGAIVTVQARNDDGCAALSARTQPDGVQRIATGGFTGTTTCSGTFAIGSVSGVTLDIETTNAAGTASTGNAITILQAATAVDDTLSSADSGGPWALDVLANDTGTNLQVVAIGTVSKTSGSGTCGTITNDTWSIGYTPGGGNAVCTFTYQAQSFWEGSPYGNPSGATVTVNQAVNTAPSLSISQPDGFGDTGKEGGTFTINYGADDPDGDAITVDFYYDTDSDGAGGTAIASCQNLPAKGVGLTCDWTNLPAAGNYYVYGIAYDAYAQTTAVSTGTVVVQADVTVLDIWVDYGEQTPANKSGNSGTNLPSDITISSGTSRVMLVAITSELAGDSTTHISSVRVNDSSGTLFTEIDTTVNNARQHAWMGYIKDADIPGTTFRLYVTYSSGQNINSYHVKYGSYAHVDQSVVYGDRVRNNANAMDITFNSQLDHQDRDRTVVVGAEARDTATAVIDNHASDPLTEIVAATRTINHASRIFESAAHTATGNYPSTTTLNHSGGDSRAALVGATLQGD